MTEESVPWTFPLHDSIKKCLLIYGSVVFQLTVHNGVGGLHHVSLYFQLLSITFFLKWRVKKNTPAFCSI